MKWLDELVGASKKEVDNALNQVDELDDLARGDIDWMTSRRRQPGNLGGKVLTIAQIKALRATLQKKGIRLIMESDTKAIKRLFDPIDEFKNADELFEYMSSLDPPNVGGYHAPTRQFILSNNATEIVAFHEMAHVKHMELVGESVYFGLSKLEKETYVWNQIYGQKAKWTTDELYDALRDLNDNRVRFGLDKITL